jgi:Ca2+-binding EF-hand superfamily protein
MINTMMKIALTGLMAAGIVAYGQEPAAQPQQQPGPAQAQSQSQTPAQPAAQSAKAEDVFAALDTNHDGKLSQEEFGKLFRNAKEADVVTEFTRWDKNGDKVITVEEFKAVYPQAQH